MLKPKAVTYLLDRSKWVAASLCAYETLSITTGRVPTLTEISRRCKPLGPALVLALAVHLLRSRPVTVQVVVADRPHS